MSSVAVKQLDLLTAKDEAMDALLVRHPDTDSVEYKKKAKLITQIFKQGNKSLKAQSAEEHVPTEHQSAIADLKMKDKEYSEVYKFDDVKVCKASLRALATDWNTPPYGQHGGNPWRTHHGGPRGCFLIKVDKVTKIAVLCAADDNDHDLPDDMPGAQAVEDDDDDDAGDHEEHEKDLAVLIAGAGVSVASLKAMDIYDRSTHATKCSVDRSISAKSVTELALKMGCPTDENTKAKRLHWVFISYI